MLPAIAIWGVAAWAVGVPGVALWVAAGAAGLGLVLLILACAPGRAGVTAFRLLAVTCAALVLVSVRIDGLEQVRDSPELRAASETGERIELRATLSGFPTAQTDAAVDVESAAAAPPNERAWVRADIEADRGEVPVLLWLEGATPADWAPGTAVALVGRLSAFDAGSQSAFGVDVDDIETSASQGPSVGRVAAHLRRALREAAASKPGAELVPGFAVGDTSLVPEPLEEQMLETSLTHLTAVSGANCALVIGAVVAVATYLGAGRRIRLLLASAGLIGFVVVVGPDASVQRAALMAGVMLLSGFGGKRGLALPALAVAMLGLLMVDPWQSRQAGFFLSVAATGGILLLVPTIERFLRRKARLPKPLAMSLAVVLAAQFSCAPLLLLLQPGLPMIGTIANLLAAPAAPVGTGLGLLAMLLLPVAPVLGDWMVVLASVPTRWVSATAEVTADLPFGRWHWPEGWGGALLLLACQAAGVLAAGVASGRLSRARSPARRSRELWGAERWKPDRGRRALTALLACGSLGVLLSVTLVVPATDVATTPRGWAVVACDVGQGDAIMLRDPDHPSEVLLVDTGDDPELLEACLRRFGVERIALLVLSHDDADHVGALERIASRVDSAMVAPNALDQVDADGAADRWVLRVLTEHGVPVVVGAEGMRGAPGGSMTWEVLAPKPGATPATTNAASLVIRVETAGISTLLLGDTGEEEQLALLLGWGERLRADVVKVAHHGSRDQAPELYRAIGADLGLISVGPDNGYGHPTGDTLRMLDATGTRSVRTDEHGAIAVSLRAGELSVWVERADLSEARATVEGWQQRAEVRRAGRRRRRRSRSSSGAKRSPPRSC
ncbi:ComEC/Rec2 family competence protein [Leucobacter sp. GX24907]